MRRVPEIIISAIAVQVFAAPAGAAEDRSFAVTVFDVAGYYYPNGEDCPEGFNVSGHLKFIRHKLLELGYKKSDVERFLDPDGSDSTAELVDIITYRGRIDGKPVDVYRHPESVPDPHIKTAAGHYSYGFNLDGIAKPGDFVDPDTGEHGIDNNLYRVLACTPYDPDNPRAGNPAVSRAERIKTWRGVWPSYLIELSDVDNYESDDDVTVGFYASLDFVGSDAAGNVAKHMTMRVDPDRRWQNRVHGRIKDGLLITEPFNLNLPGHPYAQVHVFNFSQTRLRLRFTAGGELNGILGGYQPWLPLYARETRIAWVMEAFMGVDVPGKYYALKRMADAYPDPQTGQNTMISASYFIEAVPVNITHHSAESLSASKLGTR